MEKQLTAVEWLYDQLDDDFLWSEMGINMLTAALAMEKKQHQETWETAHQAGRFEGKGIAEENWQTWETYWLKTFKSE